MSSQRKNREEYEEQASGSIVDKIWNTFSSMKLGIVLLLIIAVASIIGTILPQENGAGWQEYLAAGKPSGILTILGFYHIYQTWYFQGLLFLLCMNLLICSIARIKVIIATLKQPKFVSEKYIKQLRHNSSGKMQGSVTEAAKAFENSLNKKGYRVFTKEEDGKVLLASDKGRFGILGAYITHISFIIIIIGAILSVFGFDTGGAYPIPEGQVFNTKELENSGFKNVPDFQVRVNGFWIEKNEKGETKDYFSDLTVIKNGKELPSKIIQVNTPLKYEGVAFYQSSYEREAYATFKFTDASGKTQTLNAKELDMMVDGRNGSYPFVNIQGTNVSFIVFSIVPNFDPSNPLKNNANNFKPNKPGVAINIFEGNNPKGIKGIEKGKSIDIAGGKLEFVDFQTPKNITYLQMRKDPGEWTVWTGSVLLVLGIYLSFLMQPRKVWAIFSEAKDATAVEVGGLTSKNKMAFDQEFKLLAENIKETKGSKVKEAK